MSGTTQVVDLSTLDPVRLPISLPISLSTQPLSYQSLASEKCEGVLCNQDVLCTANDANLSALSNVHIALLSIEAEVWLLTIKRRASDLHGVRRQAFNFTLFSESIRFVTLFSESIRLDLASFERTKFSFLCSEIPVANLRLIYDHNDLGFYLPFIYLQFTFNLTLVRSIVGTVIHRAIHSQSSSKFLVENETSQRHLRIASIAFFLNVSPPNRYSRS